MTDAISEIIHQRSIPGFLIMDAGYTPLYANKEAINIIFGDGISLARRDGRLLQGPVPAEIVALCNELNAGCSSSSREEVVSSEMIDATTGGRCSLRVFPIATADGEKKQHIMVLMERIVAKHEIDYAKAKEVYHLSKREMEILRCVCRGLTNKEIAEIKFISEYTVKDHIKKIMRNMGVSSRSEILPLLLE